MTTDPLDLDRAAAEYDAVVAAALPPETRATAQPHPPDLAQSPAILRDFAEAVRLRGVVGESATAQLVYLAFTSRLLQKPVSVAVKGHSASGKSFTVQTTREFFPKESILEFTATSPKALVHSQEPYEHRTIVFYEVTGLRENNEDDITSYVIRTLLSEGRLIYEYTAGTPAAGFYTKRIEKEGPTNLVVTTTATKIHAENETRLLSLNTDDSPEQTARILAQLAAEGGAGSVDLRPWHALQRWLAAQKNQVTIPYAGRLAEEVPPVAIRLRRDFQSILSLIRAHAVLHQASRSRDEGGSIVATLDDYAVIRELVADVIAEGVEQTVPAVVREVVETVAAHPGETAESYARRLKIDKSNATRRLRRARDGGYVTNTETRPGRPGKWEPGEPLPEEVDILPAPDVLSG